MISHRSHIIYLVTILFKGVFAVGECLSGLVLYFVTTDYIREWNKWILHLSIFADPNDVRMGPLRHYLENAQFHAKTFVALYLVIHGLLKVGIVAGLLSGRESAYPVGLAGLGLFVIYQLYHYFTHGHIILVVLAALDVFIMVLVWREWQEEKVTHKHSKKQHPPPVVAETP